MSVTRLKEIDPSLDELQHHQWIHGPLVEPRLVLGNDLGDLVDDLLGPGEVEVKGFGPIGVEGVDEEPVNVGSSLGGLLGTVAARFCVVPALRMKLDFFL